MNKTLSALMTKLKWQLADMDKQLQLINKQLDELEQRLNENQQKIDKACEIPAFILPEKEIARLNFMIGESQRQEELNTGKTELLSQKNNLTSRKIRLNTELKMLERHQANQLVAKRFQAILIEQKNTDEWVLQQRDLA